MDKLSTIGSKINVSVTDTKMQWRGLSKINSNVPSILLLYGKFLIYVLNEQGHDLIKKSKKLAYRQLELRREGLADIENPHEPIPMIMVGNLKGEPGYIKKANLHFSSLFGHYREEIIDKKINMLMPQVYANVHDEYLRQFLESISS